MRLNMIKFSIVNLPILKKIFRDSYHYSWVHRTRWSRWSRRPLKTWWSIGPRLSFRPRLTFWPRCSDLTSLTPITFNALSPRGTRLSNLTLLIISFKLIFTWRYINVSLMIVWKCEYYFFNKINLYWINIYHRLNGN